MRIIIFDSNYKTDFSALKNFMLQPKHIKTSESFPSCWFDADLHLLVIIPLPFNDQFYQMVLSRK